MCDLTKQFKLCTCSGKADTTGSYWIFYKYRDGKDVWVIGQTEWPAFIDPETDKQNKTFLEQALNFGYPFDTDLEPQENDRLALFFKPKWPQAASKHISYGFEFSNNRWRATTYDRLGWANKYDVQLQGEIDQRLGDMGFSLN